MEVYYRFDVRSKPGLNGIKSLEVCLDKYQVIKHTKCGVWVSLDGGGKVFVDNKARKKFAYPTISEAMESFKRRKTLSLMYCKKRLERAQAEKELAVKFVEWKWAGNV